MFVIQSADEETKGWYLRGFVKSMPVWTDEKSDARSYQSQDDTALDEKLLETHHHPCWVIPA